MMKYRNKSYKIWSNDLQDTIASFQEGEHIISITMLDLESSTDDRTLLVVTEYPDSSVGKNLLLEEAQKRKG